MPSISDFQPKLAVRSVVQSFIGSFCTLTYELENSEGMAKYPSCTNKIRVNFTVSPKASITNTTNNNIAEYNITNLTRCTEYDTFVRYYLAGQEMDVVYAADSVMTSKLSIHNNLQSMHGPPNNALKLDLEARLTY